MGEHRQEDNLEKFFKQQFEEHPHEPEGWNEPSLDLWDKIQESVGEEEDVLVPVRQLNPYWRWGAMAASFLLCCSVIGFWWYRQEQVATMANTIQKQQAKIDSLTSKIVEGQGNTLPSNEPNNQIVAHRSEALEERTVGDVSSNSQVVEEKNTLGGNTIVKKETTKNEGVNLAKAADLDIIDDVQSVENSLIPIPSVVKGNKAEEYVLGLGGVDFSDNNSGVGDNTSREDRAKKNMDRLDYLAIKHPFIEAASLAIEVLPKVGAASMVVPSKPKSGKFYAMLEASPMYVKTTFEEKGPRPNNNPGEPLREKKKPEEKLRLAYNLGGRLGYAFHPNWGIETGLEYNVVKTSSTHQHELKYRPEEERQDPNGDRVNDYSLGIMGTSGDADLEISVKSVEETPAVAPSDLVAEIRLDSEHSFLDIPLYLRYQKSIGKRWKVHALAGVEYHMALKNRMEFKDISLSGDLERRFEVKRQPERRRLEPKQDVKNDWQYTVGLGLDYHLTKNWSLYLTPTFSSPFQAKELRHSSMDRQDFQLKIGARVNI